MKSFITYLTEKKDHIIKRLKNLTDDEKDQVITFFNRKPNLENKINWNNRELTFKDFQGVMDTTKTERRKAVKKQGIRGLKEGKDFLELKLPEDSPFSAYIPFHYEASKLIGSSKIGGVQTKWCISGNEEKYWASYIYLKNLIPVMFVDYEGKEKYALMVRGADLSFGSFWGKDDNNLGERGCKDQFGPHWKDEIVISNSALLRKARTILDENPPVSWFEKGIDAGRITVLNPVYKINNDKLVWRGGTWKSGTWKDGMWVDGVWGSGTWEKGHWKKGTWETGTWKDGWWWDGEWRGGTWEGGTWMDGTWKSGTWEYGDWNRGIWKKGTWEDGTWWNGEWCGGTWQDGTWKDGTWKGGVWKKGTWKGGYDKNGNFHKAGDSPNKWNLK